MSRLCLDCGIAWSQDCVCDRQAGLDHPRNPYQERERRVSPILPASVNGASVTPKDGDPDEQPSGATFPPLVADPFCAAPAASGTVRPLPLTAPTGRPVLHRGDTR